MASVKKHGLSGYTGGCRCDACRAAKRDYERGRRNARDAAQCDETRWRAPWTTVDFEVLSACYGRVPTIELARELGHPVSTVRTYAHDLGLTKKKGWKA